MKKTWCSQCRVYMVVCQHCGNNTCNGGYLEIRKMGVK